jgi:hypothetical protein
MKNAFFGVSGFAAVQILLCTAILIAAQSNAPGSVKFLGEFSNVRHTAEHSYGTSVQLWQEGPRVFGLLFDAGGTSGDTPVGLLQDVDFTSATGALSFTAKLSIGAIYLGKGKQEPTHDVYTFKGTLLKSTVSGALTHVDQQAPKSTPDVKQARLPRTNSSPVIEANTFEEWTRAAQQLLQRRGPKW